MASIRKLDLFEGSFANKGYMPSIILSLPTQTTTGILLSVSGSCLPACLPFDSAIQAQKTSPDDSVLN